MSGMLYPYYKLPLELEKIVGKKEVKKCSLKESIAHHLHLMLTTAFGELQSDAQFGNELWDEDFDNVSYRNKQKEKILLSLGKTIARFEKRIEKVKIEMRVQQEENASGRSDPGIKRKLEFTITAVISATNEPIVYRDGFFISPLAYN
ncbi:GPW/gp25 family protein [Niabella pedocola]|uniref:GPW/gp25 family protein n=1 Tax=Niabella pedocola TaxID=1752077 RepID=A0ABS8PR68_9BACT|nr:GPW/gp25 family protein [Niabella pedocola]MCD2423582.1 GPW/gp25 family protein [Niabella pedocola]